MVNFIKAVVFLTLVLLIKCQAIKRTKNECLENGIIINSDTKIHHVHYLENNYTKVGCFSGLLNSSASNECYNGFPLKSKTLLLKILVLVDYKMYEVYKNNLTNLYSHVITKWNEVDSYFQILSLPKIKLLLNGIVVPTHPDIFEQPIEIENQKGSYYPFNSTLKKIENWVNDNTYQFENFECDLFFFMTQSLLVNDDYSKYNFYVINGLMNKFQCPKNFPKSNKISGGISYDNDKFGVSTARAIATGLGVPYDEESGCGSEFIMTIFESNTPNSWSRCSTEQLKAIFRKKKFSCYKMKRHLMIKKIINDL